MEFPLDAVQILNLFLLCLFYLCHLLEQAVNSSVHALADYV